jgi:hypothetical protein
MPQMKPSAFSWPNEPGGRAKWEQRSAAQARAAAEQQGTAFLSTFPGSAPTERGRAPARRHQAAWPRRSLPGFLPEAKSRQTRSCRAAGRTERVSTLCWRAAWRGGWGAELPCPAMIFAAAAKPQADSAAKRSVRPERSEDGADDRPRSQPPRESARKGGGARSLPGRSRIKEALRKHGFRWDGEPRDRRARRA